MWQELPAGRKIWENVTEERVRSELEKMCTPSDPDIERKMIGMMRGDVEQGLYGFFRWFGPESGRTGNPSL